MLKELLLPLIEHFSFLRIFQYITFRAAYAAVTALFISFIFGPRLIKWLKRIKAGETIRDDGPQTHMSKSGTPTMGGLLIIASILFSILLWQDLRSPNTWIAVFSLLGFGLIGFLDDYLKVFKKVPGGLHARFKLIGQFVVSAVIVMVLYFNSNDQTTLLYIPFFKFPVIDLSILYIPFAILFLVGMSNAVNLTDGLDGLASGLMIFVGITFAILAYLTGNIKFAEYLQIPYLAEGAELTILCFAMVGAGIGFLWYNAHPAEIMMGDTGSLPLGGLMGVVALMIKKEMLLIIVGGVFVIDLLSVVIQVISFKLTGKRVFRMAPLHHHFELKGWKESKVVIRFWILGGLFAILSLSTLKIQ